jgi:hypothetical protein
MTLLTIGLDSASEISSFAEYFAEKSLIELHFKAEVIGLEASICPLSFFTDFKAAL